MRAYYVQCCETGDCYNDGQWCEEPEFFPSFNEAVRKTRAAVARYPHPTQVQSAEVDVPEPEYPEYPDVDDGAPLKQLGDDE